MSAGFGNKTAPQPTYDETDESYRFGKHSDGGAYSNAHHRYGSGATSGAGFGNKTKPETDMYDNTDLRFGSHDSTAPYSGGHPHYGSGITGGAGFGNKTGHIETEDSTVGKVLEKVGVLVKNEGLVEKGHAKRLEAGLGKQEVHV